MIPFVDGCTITSIRGIRRNPVSGKTEFHAGVDMVPVGNDKRVIACVDGVVTDVDEKGTGARGKYVVVELPQGAIVVYQHLSDVYAAKNTKVYPNTVIGVMGMSGSCTGPHLHIEMWTGYKYFEYFNKNWNKYTSFEGNFDIAGYLGIKNEKGTFRQNDVKESGLIMTDIVTYEENDDGAFIAVKYDPSLDALASGISVPSGYLLENHGAAAVMCGGENIGAFADSLELKTEARFSGNKLSLSFSTERGVPKAECGDIVCVYIDEIKKVLFAGRICSIDRDTDTFNLSALDRPGLLSGSDMTITFNDGQTIAHAIEALGDHVGLSCSACLDIKAVVDTQSLFYKSTFDKIADKLLDRAHTHMDGRYYPSYNYELAKMEVLPFGENVYRVKLSDIKSISMTCSTDDMANAVGAYDSDTKGLREIVYDDESIKKYGMTVRYLENADGVMIRLELQKSKKPISEGKAVLYGDWGASVGSKLVFDSDALPFFGAEGGYVIISVTQKVGEEHETEIKFEEYIKTDSDEAEAGAEALQNAEKERERRIDKRKIYVFRSSGDITKHLKSHVPEKEEIGDSYFNATLMHNTRLSEKEYKELTDLAGYSGYARTLIYILFFDYVCYLDPITNKNNKTFSDAKSPEKVTLEQAREMMNLAAGDRISDKFVVSARNEAYKTVYEKLSNEKDKSEKDEKLLSFLKVHEITLCPDGFMMEKLKLEEVLSL